MKDDATNLDGPTAGPTNAPNLPAAVDRATFQAELDRLRVREKAHTREGDAIAAARRRLPMVEVDANLALVGPRGSSPCSTRSRGAGSSSPTTSCGTRADPRPSSAKAAPSTAPKSRSCHTFIRATSPTPPFVRAHTTKVPATATSWDGTCLGTPHRPHSTRSLGGRQVGLFHLVCYLRDGERVFETYWTTRRGVEAMDNSYALMDLTVYGRQERWEDSPSGWPQRCSNTRTDAGSPGWPPVSVWPGGRPIAQWSRLEAGRSDDLRSPATRG